nr:MAG TPA: hypothetical protein [Caudoviricetes sp.]
MEKDIKNFGIILDVIVFAKEAEQAKSLKQRHSTSYIA